MSASRPSIEQLQELPLPVPPYSFFPQTWAWLGLLLLVLGVVVVWGLLRWKRWRRDAYRREALARLAQLDAALKLPEQRLDALRELPALLKRVAMSMPTQTPVGPLGGDQWQAFLDRHVATPLPSAFATQLFTLAYAPDERVRSMSPEQATALHAECRHWVEAHHVAV